MRISPIEIAFSKSYLNVMSRSECEIGTAFSSAIGDPIRRVQLY